MTIYNLGSINADYFYRVPHLPQAGETLAANTMSSGLGGKGANQSVAAVRAGATVCHIGAVGPDGGWAIDRMRSYGVDCSHIIRVEQPTAHAIITIDPAGENAIVLFSGANNAQDINQVQQACGAAGPVDYFLLQNETSHQVAAAKIASDAGMQVVYSAAPFQVEAVRAVLPYISILIMNEIESEQLTQAMGHKPQNLPVPNALITRGAQGADWIDTNSGETVTVPAFSVTPVDTTGAGDTFAGYVIAGLSQNMAPPDALRMAAAAAAIKVTRPGTADAIPDRAEVDAFLAQHA